MNKHQPQVSRALPPGTALPHNYIIESVLGEGGFGITYSCTLLHTEERFAVKEYFPLNIAYRSTENGSHTITPYTGQQEPFEKQKRHALTEAGMLLKFQHLEHIVSVKDILEANGTLYLVMEYLDGITLKQYVTDNEPLPFDELSSLLTPVMRDLIQIHKQGMLHRDISPDNLIIGTDNRLHLIDFGSADYESIEQQDMKTVMFKSGFAPPEQYWSNGKLGAWTDVYGMCATMYYALTGFTPTESVRRLQNDELPPLSDHAQIRSCQAEIIEKGLALHTGDRYQSMEALYQAVIIPPVEISSQRNENIQQSIKHDKTVIPSGPIHIPGINAAISGADKSHNHSKQKKRYAIGIVLLIILLIYGGLRASGVTLPLWSQKPNTSTSIGEDTTSDSTTDNDIAHGTSMNEDTSSGASTTSDTEVAMNSIDSTTQNATHTMLNLVGSTLEDAQHALYMLDPSLQVEIIYAYDDTLEPDTVTSQSIASGTAFTQGSLGTILLTVNKKETATTETVTTKEQVVQQPKNSTTKQTTQAAQTTQAKQTTPATQSEKKSKKKTEQKSTKNQDIFIELPDDDEEYDTFIN